MKIYFQTFVSLSTISILSIVLIVGCKKMDDHYRQFVETGETIYIGKADSIIVRGGDNRAEISWLLMSDPKVSSYKLFWNNGRDSIENLVTKTDHVDTIRVMLNNMPEGTHHFEIVTFDKYGNSSVPARASGRVYGPQYGRTLLNSNRIVRALDRANKDLIINWMPADITLAGVELEYVNGQGVTEVHSIPAILDTYILSDFPTDGTFKHRSLFVPDALALDTFYTEYQDTQVDDQMIGGRNLSFTTEARSGTLPNNQLSIWVSTDFDGIYEVENVEAATWVEITDMYRLASATNNATAWGPINLWDMMGAGDSQIYVAFKYVFNPSNTLQNSGINWRIANLAVRTNTGAQLLNQEQVGFTIVHKGPWEIDRYYANATLLLLRRNAADQVTPTTTWAISRALQ